jgi:midasin
LKLEISSGVFISILSQLLRKPGFQNGPLAFVVTSPSVEDIDRLRLHRLLLAYYRILQANRELSHNLLWPLTPLSVLFWTPYPDPGVRLLAIRCYAMQSGMGEAEREKLETEILGKICRINCQIEYGQKIDGSSEEMDGWIMPALELKRIIDARNAILSDAQNCFILEEGDDNQPIDPSDLRQVYLHACKLLCC